MTRSVAILLVDRAVNTFDRLARRLLYDYRLPGHAFEYPSPDEDEGCIEEGPDPFEETIWDSIVTDRRSFILPEHEAVGLLFRLPIGVFVLGCSSVWPFQTAFKLSLIVVFCDYDGHTDEYLLSRLLDPERRVGLGAWYEASVRVEAENPGRWGHGFYAHRDDPRRSKLDRMWRTHERKRARTPVHQQGDLLLAELYAHALCKLRF